MSTKVPTSQVVFLKNRITLVKKRGRFGRYEFYIGLSSGKNLEDSEEIKYVISKGEGINPRAIVHFFDTENI